MNDTEIRAAVKSSGMVYGDVYSLAGPSRAARRQALYSALTGRKCTRSESGINAIQSRLFELSGVTGSCLAARVSALDEWLNS